MRHLLIQKPPLAYAVQTSLKTSIKSTIDPTHESISVGRISRVSWTSRKLLGRTNGECQGQQIRLFWNLLLLGFHQDPLYAPCFLFMPTTYLIRSLVSVIVSDLKLLHNEPDVNCCRLQDDLKILESWCSFNKLFFNAKKCFFNIRNCANLNIGEEVMKAPDYVKHLRLITDAKLWTNHIEYIKKAHGFYQFCRRNS